MKAAVVNLFRVSGTLRSWGGVRILVCGNNRQAINREIAKQTHPMDGFEWEISPIGDYRNWRQAARKLAVAVDHDEIKFV